MPSEKEIDEEALKLLKGRQLLSVKEEVEGNTLRNIQVVCPSLPPVGARVPQPAAGLCHTTTHRVHEAVHQGHDPVRDFHPYDGRVCHHRGLCSRYLYDLS